MPLKKEERTRKDRTLIIRIDSHTYSFLDEVAQNIGISMSELARRIIHKELWAEMKKALRSRNVSETAKKGLADHHQDIKTV